MRREGRPPHRPIVHNEQLYFWLNQHKAHRLSQRTMSIGLYWAPRDIHALKDHLERLGYGVSEITDRDYGQTEFFVTDDDGYSHCFGVATNKDG